jgi:hypothetical protein
MSTATIETLTKMLESLPEPLQDRAVEHLREYLEEVTDEMRWDSSFAKSSGKLVDAAREARHESLNGTTEPLDLDRL